MYFGVVEAPFIHVRMDLYHGNIYVFEILEEKIIRCFECKKCIGGVSKD
jgi:hypothetical protein